MPLREYQNAFTNNIIRLLRDLRRVCAQLSTGGGKTFIFSHIAHRYVTKNSDKSVLILVHRKELLLQTRKCLYNNYGIDAFMITAGVKYIPPCPVYIGMVESVNRRLPKIKNVGLVIIDECHIAAFNKLHIPFSEQLIIGFTATPVSSSKKNPLKNYYDDIVVGPPISFLIKEGFLSQNVTRSPKDVVDRALLTVDNKGEFTDESQYQQFGKVKYINNTVLQYEKWCKGEKTLIFNVNINHSKQVNKAFCDAGYNSKHLDSTMTDQERAAIWQWYENTDDAILNNVGIATIGTDVPTIRNVIVNKSTMSMPLWIQMCGRGGRVTPFKKMFNIVDMGGNWATHGDWHDERDWHKLFHNPPKPAKDAIAPVKSCPMCDGILHAAVRVCNLMNEAGEICGYIFPEKDIPIEQEMSEFVVVTKEINVDQLLIDNQHRKDYYTLFKIGVDLSKKAKQTLNEMSNDRFNFIVDTYYTLGKEWAAKMHEKYPNGMKDDGKKLKFNEWHKDLVAEHLMKEIKTRFPKWDNSELIAYFEKKKEERLNVQHQSL